MREGMRRIKTARNLWREVFDRIADAIIVVDSDLKPVPSTPPPNDAGGVATRRSLFSSILRHNDWLGRMIQSCPETGQNLGDPEATFNIGPRAIIVAEISPLAGSDGQIGGAIMLVQDLSHQKSAEHAVEGPQYFGSRRPASRMRLRIR